MEVSYGYLEDLLFVTASFKGATMHVAVGVWHKTLSLRDVTV